MVVLELCHGSGDEFRARFPQPMLRADSDGCAWGDADWTGSYHEGPLDAEAAWYRQTEHTALAT